jgi:hypothetical protein
MKKTNAIQLVLITAAMAACNRPLYQQRAEGYEDPGYSADASASVPTAGPGPGGAADADAPDSTNSCPVESSFLPPDYYDWYNGAGAFGSITVNFNINGYYTYHNPPPLVRVNPIRSLFTRAFASIAAAHETMSHTPALRTIAHHSAGVRNMPTSNHQTVARSGFGARIGAAAHS